MLQERRRARSSETVEAISLLLHRTKDKLNAPAITLGTPSGALLVGAGNDLTRVARMGADVDSGKEVDEPVATWRLRVGEQDFVLTSMGGAMDAELGAGVRRIVESGVVNAQALG